jgi:hypothetical protein
MEEKKCKTIKEELQESFSNDYIYNAGLLVHSLAEKFYEENGLEGKVYFNDDIFGNCLIDILVDIARLKYFHDINLVNYIKLISYTASWIIKRKPFQLIEGTSEEYLYVNEKFAFSLLLQAVGFLDGNARVRYEDKEKLEKNMSAIFYHLKYRNTNPQTLELLLVGIENGKLYIKS